MTLMRMLLITTTIIIEPYLSEFSSHIPTFLHIILAHTNSQLGVSVFGAFKLCTVNPLISIPLACMQTQTSTKRSPHPLK